MEGRRIGRSVEWCGAQDSAAFVVALCLEVEDAFVDYELSGRVAVFFFSSRRRHTRFDCDWSSDVCSSDLGQAAYALVLAPKDHRSLVGQVQIDVDGKNGVPLRLQVFARGASTPAFQVGFKIGRASCRERV